MQLSLLDRAPAQAGSALGTDEGEWASDAAWKRVRRIDLGDGAWLELGRGFVPRQGRLFELLEQGADWELHERQMYERVVAVPRLVASCPGSPVRRPWEGESVVRVLPRRAPPAEVARGAAALRDFQASLSHRYGRELASISLAYYRDGSDSVAFHGDKLGALRQDTVVAILSLGAPRHFVLRRAPGYDSALPRDLLHAGVGSVRSRGVRSGGAGSRDVRERGSAERPSFVLSVGEGDLLVMGGTCQETWEHGVPKEAHAGRRIAVMFREAWGEAEGAVRNVRGPAAALKSSGVLKASGGHAAQDRRRVPGT